MDILFVIPTHNESVVIEQNLRILNSSLQRCLPREQWRILVADNGSNDRTYEIVKNLRLELSRVDAWKTQEPGRGNALRRVWQEFDADVYAYMDADLATDLKHVSELIESLSNADVATGSRLIAGSETERSTWREIVSQTYSFLVRLFLKTPVKDFQCGFKAIRKEAARALLPMTEHCGWFFDTELLVLAHHHGFRVREFPVRWVETRDDRRKSSVKIFRTATDNIRQLLRLRRKLARI